MGMSIFDWVDIEIDTASKAIRAVSPGEPPRSPPPPPPTD
jgi:hypothetical protein